MQLLRWVALWARQPHSEGEGEKLKERMGFTDTELLRKLRRPLELDLESVFKAAEEDVMRAVLDGVKSGESPTKVIDRVDAVLG
jgi:hypothetical protein